MVLAGSLAAAYAATIAVNAVRIAIAMRLASHRLAVAHLTPAQCHRLEGIVVYFAGLTLLHEIALHAQRRAAFLRSNL
jgi:hypothetical protein